MNSEEAISRVPLEIRTASWFQSIIELLQEQTRIIQGQIERISALEKTVLEQKDEIARLRKMPKRPKFRLGGGDPNSRSGQPGNTAESGRSNSANRMAPQKVRQEVRIPALGVPYIRTDDTGAKHQHKSEYCTHIGGEYFAFYKTTSSKSRANFLKILLQGKEGYAINEAFIWHLFQCGVEDDLLNRFEDHVGKKYRKKKGLNRLLNSLEIENKKLRQQCLEAGLVGFIGETILKPGQVLLSDRAGQFAIFDHAGCWVHMERPLRKLEVASPEAEQELEQVRGAIWHLYAKLKEAALTQTGKEEVQQLYDRLIAMNSISPGINEVIASFARYREEMLKALDHPGLPLHNNDSERDIRGVAKRRNISGSTKSEEGKAFRDGLMTLKQTCARLGLSFCGYLKKWFMRQPVDLADIVRGKYRTVAVGPSG